MPASIRSLLEPMSRSAIHASPRQAASSIRGTAAAAPSRLASWSAFTAAHHRHTPGNGHAAKALAQSHTLGRTRGRDRRTWLQPGVPPRLPSAAASHRAERCPCQSPLTPVWLAQRACRDRAAAPGFAVHGPRPGGCGRLAIDAFGRPPRPARKGRAVRRPGTAAVGVIGGWHPGLPSWPPSKRGGRGWVVMYARRQKTWFDLRKLLGNKPDSRVSLLVKPQVKSRQGLSGLWFGVGFLSGLFTGPPPSASGCPGRCRRCGEVGHRHQPVR